MHLFKDLFIALIIAPINRSSTVKYSA